MKKFTGQLAFLSNMHPCRVEFDNMVYQCAEAAYQAAKTTDMELRKKFTQLNGYEAKRLNRFPFRLERSFTLREDWKEVKLAVMQDILLSKFSDNPELKAALLETPDSDLEETNYWHDNYWGNCTCFRCVNIPGQNMLGVLLMELRTRLQQQEDK